MMWWKEETVTCVISLNRRMGELTLTGAVTNKEEERDRYIVVERSAVVAMGDRCECFLLIASIFSFFFSPVKSKARLI